MCDLVTGATGFIGSHLTRELLSRGRDVRILVRCRQSATDLEKLGARVHLGDITVPST